MLQTKAFITAHLISLPKIAKEAHAESFELFKSYADLLLPTLEKSVTMKEMTKEEKEKVKAELKKANQELKERMAKAKSSKLRHK